ncbi:hypothetical protein L486_06291 [Kwoniella mangroviensis CBS 10435]|uniref:Nucleoside phosphatase n=1 Tax=Kwoniella mangroviensis CBS 10435 TaxID=1331196 RepID=A0A1B9IL21_9TREE|nr:hypothetical protein L486_06291 [Kwoniella mangroviensis CBS 10435]
MAPSISSSTTHYALVIDAGSSGSRLQIYSWRDPDLERAEILQEVSYAQQVPEKIGKSRWWWNSSLFGKGKGKGKGKEVENVALRRLVRVGKGVEGDDWVKRVEPGISTVSPEDIPNYLSPLLSHALRHIPPSQHHSTPIYILATAGMRLLPEKTREAILQASCDLIKNEYPFKVDGPSSAGPCGENIRVISGEEEGMWGWVAVNYLMDGFAPPNSISDSVTPVDVSHHSPTFGFLDMGGASTQLAFSPSPHEILQSGYPEDDLRKVSLRLLSGEVVEWPVFVASWLGFGTNRARERYVEYLIENWKKDNPTMELSGTGLDKPIEDPCLPKDLEISSTSGRTEIKFKGTGSFSECLMNLTPLLEHSKACPTDHCLFAGLPTPHIDFTKDDQRGFIGISEYWYTAQQVLGLGGIWDWGEWEKGMNDFCMRDWKDIEGQVEKENGWRGSEADLSRLQMQCFKGAWISNVLHEGIGIPRLVDAGGNNTLTGGEVGETNEEAERRAREKGLFENGSKTHFQSMDEIGETAISWTLGKMVIEASKAVKPRSHSIENAWISKISHNIPLPLIGLENKLQKIGIQTLWAYGFVSFFILACLFNCFRRRFYSYSSTTGGKRGRNRKPSISDYDRSIEDGFISDSSISLNPTSSGGSGRTRYKTGSGKLRLWTLRIGNSIRRNIPFGDSHNGNGRRNGTGFLPRHNSMPLPLSNFSSSDSSQPPSPTLNGNNNGFFVPANIIRPNSTGPTSDNGLGLGLGLGSSTSPNLNSSFNPTSPPSRKSTSRSGKPRQISSNLLLSSSWEKSSNSGGWNDPPPGLFDDSPAGGSRSRESSLALAASSSSSTTTPNANYSSSTTANAISRNSSRVNLSELGLAQRSLSRAGTPGFDNDH